MLPVSRSKKNSVLHVDVPYIKGLLTRDHMSRKDRKWRLLTPFEMEQIFKGCESWVMDADTYDGDFYLVTREFEFMNYPIDDERDIFSYSWKFVEERAIQTIEIRFPLVTQLLLHFNGKLIAAGGAVTKALLVDIPEEHERNLGQDIDLFFIDPEVEREDIPDYIKRQKYDEWLISAISYLTERWLIKTDKRGVVFVLRNEHVTTVFLSDVNRNLNIKYQFIHRVYPNIGSVLGGFDLGPAMISFTGHNIVATELGAWSALNKTVIVDVSRRSTSFEHRLIKYSKFCHILFPGLSANVTPTKSSQRRPIEEVNDILNRMVIESATHIQNESQIGDEFRNELCQTAFNNGYILDIARYSELFEEEGSDNKPTKISDYLRKTVSILKLPFVDIRLPRKHSIDKEPEWSLRLRKDPSVLYAINYFPCQQDYDPEVFYDEVPVFVTQRGHYRNRHYASDYDGNPIWPSMLAESNFSKLVNNNIDGVVSVSIFHFAYARNDDNVEAQSLEGINECVWDLADSKDENLSYEERIRKILRMSLTSPQIGDTNPAFGGFGRPADWYYEQCRMAQNNAPAAIRKLTGVNWILKNPGRQWTSAINPIIADPRDWYGEYYRSFRIGNYDIEMTLRLARLRQGNFFSKRSLQKEIFEMILRYTIWADSFE